MPPLEAICTILELTEHGSQLQLVAGVGWHPDRMDTVTVRLDQASQARLTLRSPNPIYIDDMCQETRFTRPGHAHHGWHAGHSPAG